MEKNLHVNLNSQFIESEKKTDLKHKLIFSSYFQAMTKIRSGTVIFNFEISYKRKKQIRKLWNRSLNDYD